MSNYSTVDKIVRETLIKMGEDTLHKYSLLLVHANTFLEEFNIDTAQELKTVKLEMDSHRKVMLPDDYIDFSKVGIQVGDRVRLLTYNAELAKLPACENEATANIYRPIDADEFGVPFINYRGHELVGYGKGHYKEGFIIDRGLRIIRFGTEINVGNIYLEYISNQVEVCAETPVNPLAKDALQNWILWHYYLHRKDPIYPQYEQYYYRAERKMHNRMDPFSIADIQAILEDNYSLLPKS